MQGVVATGMRLVPSGVLSATSPTAAAAEQEAPVLMPLDLPTSAPTGAVASNPTSAEHRDITAAVEAARGAGKEARAAEATHGTRAQ